MHYALLYTVARNFHLIYPNKVYFQYSWFHNHDPCNFVLSTENSIKHDYLSPCNYFPCIYSCSWNDLKTANNSIILAIKEFSMQYLYHNHAITKWIVYVPTHTLASKFKALLGWHLMNPFFKSSCMSIFINEGHLLMELQVQL